MSTERPNIGKSYFSSRLRSDAEDVHFPVNLPSSSEKHCWKSQVRGRRFENLWLRWGWWESMSESLKIYSIKGRLDLVVNYSICKETRWVGCLLNLDYRRFIVFRLFSMNKFKFSSFNSESTSSAFSEMIPHFLSLFQVTAHVWLLFPHPKTGGQLLRYLQQAVQWKTDNNVCWFCLRSFSYLERVSSQCFTGNTRRLCENNQRCLKGTFFGMLATGLWFIAKQLVLSFCESFYFFQNFL